MTAQVPDGYMYEGKEYSIIAMSKNINFNIEDFGIQPEYTCTACWRGFAIDYSIENAKLLLKTIWVSQSSSGYPDVNGVKVKKLEKRGIFSSYVPRGTPYSLILGSADNLSRMKSLTELLYTINSLSFNKLMNSIAYFRVAAEAKF